MVLGFGQNTKIVILGLIEFLSLVSLHFHFCGPSYDIFSKTGRIGLSQEFQVNFGSGQNC